MRRIGVGRERTKQATAGFEVAELDVENAGQALPDIGGALKDILQLGRHFFRGLAIERENNGVLSNRNSSRLLRWPRWHEARFHAS